MHGRERGDQDDEIAVRLVDADASCDGGIMEAESDAVAGEIVVERHLDQLNHVLLSPPARKHRRFVGFLNIGQSGPTS